MIAGRLPENSNECAISLYSYYSYADFGIKTDTESISSEDATYEKIIGTSNSVHNAIFTIEDDPNKKADIEITNQKLVLESEDKGNLYLTLGHYYDHEDNSYFFNKNKTSIDKGEALISFDILYQYLFMYTDTSLPVEEGTLRYVVENSNQNFYDIFCNMFPKIIQACMQNTKMNQLSQR